MPMAKSNKCTDSKSGKFTMTSCTQSDKKHIFYMIKFEPYVIITKTINVQLLGSKIKHTNDRNIRNIYSSEMFKNIIL